MGGPIAPIGGGYSYAYSAACLMRYGGQWGWRQRAYGSESTPVSWGHTARLAKSCGGDWRGGRFVVSPATYVELRALAIAEEAIKPPAEESASSNHLGRLLRLWPFRWPTHEPLAAPLDVPAEPAAAPGPESGRYLDILF